MARFDEQVVQARLKAVTAPSRHEIRLAKRRILEHLSTEGGSSRDAIIQGFLAEENATNPGPSSIVLDQTTDVANLTDAVLANLEGDPPTVRFIRLRDAARIGLMELERSGSIVGAHGYSPTPLESVYRIQVARAGGSDNVPEWKPDLPDLHGGYMIPEVSYDPGILDADLFGADLESLGVGASTLRLLDASLGSFHQGSYVASATLLAAASEGAWYAAGEKLHSASAKKLGEALEKDNTSDVLRLVTQKLRESGVKKVEADELLAHAGVLKRIRDYGLHPRESTDELVEEYFTEEMCGLLLMTARRYLRLLSERVERSRSV
jgi:hypothetical protein